MKFQRILKLKMFGDDIKWVQNKLKDIGVYKGNIDGYFGQDLLISVTNFQRSVNIKVDGDVGLQTWSQLSVLKTKNEKTKNEIVLTASYIGEDGLKIYDKIISDDFYHTDERKKNTIWLKSSLSNYRPDLRIGSYNGKVASNYVIGGYDDSDNFWDGKILRAFDDKFWSYQFVDDNNLNSKIISIELCNWGSLVKIDNEFYTDSGLKVDNSCVIELDFMGKKYWHKYSDKQVESLYKLIKFLKRRWNIEVNSGSFNSKWFEFHKKWNSPGGIRTDSQLKMDKIGIVPQENIINMLNSL